jgi:glycyl-tRNA synthetase beta chain
VKLLLEIGTEELPAKQVMPALASLERRFAELAGEARLDHGDIETFATPRRLALRVSGVAAATPDLEEERLGPPARIARDASGAFSKAALGFAKGQGVAVEDLYEVETEKGQYLAARVREPGQAAAAVLTPLLERIIAEVPWPKPMHWGWETVSWARPVHWLIARLGAEVLPVRFADVEAGTTTRGHRFAHPEAVEVAEAGAYEEVLRGVKVVASVAERRETIVRLAKEAAAPHRLVEDAGLLDEVTQLVEWPQCATGTFAERFLELPREVLISELREHQRYFAVEDADGRLVNRFVVVYNTPVEDPSVVVRGNQRVLVARLTDGAFFLHRDKERTLASRVADLEKVVYLEKLGSIRDKVARVEALAGYVADRVAPGARGDAERAAHLCKADLTTDMVGEFPEIQGVMGRYYALHDGEPAEVAQAIEEHYLPRGAGDALPQSPAGVAVAIADKIDTIAGCFAVGLEPTGAADPYGLRRAALGIIRTVLERVPAPTGSESGLRLGALIGAALDQVGTRATRDRAEAAAAIDAFFRGRLKSMLAEETSGDVIEAVISVGIDDLPSVVERVRVLAQMRAAADFSPLATAFKRVNNILKKAQPGDAVNPALFDDDKERGLWAAFGEARTKVAAHLAAREFRAAADALVALEGPVASYFDQGPLVMAEDLAVRANRLAMLRDLQGLFQQFADISCIQAEQRAAVGDE